MEPLLTNTVKSVSPFLSALKNISNGIKDEFKDWFQIGVSDYIEDRNTKISTTNTFICRSEKVNFYDVYFPLYLGRAKQIISSENLFNALFEKSNCSTILGTAGSGKTMLMKHAFLQCYRELYAIPIFIELRDLNILKVSLLEYVYSIILKNKIKPSSKLVERALENGGFVFFFDGLDEINLDLKEKLVLEIEHLIDLYSSNKFLLTSRPGAGAENLPRFDCYTVLPLDYNQIIEFIKKQLFKTEDLELINKLTSSIDLKNKDYVEYLTNPLLLSMYIITYKSYPELPKTKNKFYWNVFDTLCTKHDSITKKGAYIHPKKTKLQNEDFEKILRWFCYISLLESQFNFDEQYVSEKLQYIKNTLKYDFDVKDLIYDLSVSISILIADGLEYKFPHRTMQDYFMVLFIKDQNESAKEIIYKDKFQRVPPLSNNQSIFDLCIELDKECYYKYYLLPLFEKFSNTYNEKSTHENLIKYVASFKADLIVKEEKDVLEMFIASRFVLPHVDVSTFFDIEIPDIFVIRSTEKKSISGIANKLIQSSDVSKRSKVAGQSKSYVFNLKDLPTEIIKELVLKYFVDEDFEEFMKAMKNRYTRLKEEFNNDQLAKIALIDFVNT